MEHRYYVKWMSIPSSRKQTVQNNRFGEIIKGPPVSIRARRVGKVYCGYLGGLINFQSRNGSEPRVYG